MRAAVLTRPHQRRPGEWRNLALFVVRDFAESPHQPVTPEAGAWPPAPGEMLIERDAFQVAKAAIGDIVTIETPSGREQTLRVAGRVHDAGQAQARMENIVYGYITLATLAALGETPALDRLNLLVGGNRFDEAHVNRVAVDVEAWLEASGHAFAGWTFRRQASIPTPRSWGAAARDGGIRHLRPGAERRHRRQPPARDDGRRAPADRRDEGDRRDARADRPHLSGGGAWCSASRPSCWPPRPVSSAAGC